MKYGEQTRPPPIIVDSEDPQTYPAIGENLQTLHSDDNELIVFERLK
jgi:hypothetical protein